MTDKFDRLISLLNKELKLTGTEIAEILWLAKQRQSPLSSATKIVTSEEETTIEDETKPPDYTQPESTITPEDKDSKKPPSRLTKTPDSPQPQPTITPEDKDSKKPPFAKVHPKSTSTSFDRDFLTIKVPDVSSVRHPLNIARALRPLIRYVPSGKEVLLDEEATVELIAELEGKIYIPVRKAPLEIQFDLALVVDESDSMIFWRRTTQELQQLFKHYGVFRNIRTWGMVTDPQGNICLRQGIRQKSYSHYYYSPKKVIDPSGRRLILVVSDCVSDIWRNGKAFSVLETWGKHNIVAIVQILPERMWLRTALSLGTMVQLDCLQPTVPNRNLFVKEILLWNDVDLKTGIKVPVFSLEPELIETWSEMVVRKGTIGAGGFVFSASSKQEQIQLPQDTDRENLSSEERVSNFQLSSSEIANNLAKLLAASPVINLPVVRLIQKTLLPQSQQVHVAEVFLGGILKPQTLITPDTNPDEVQYQFIDEKIIDILLKESPRTDSKEIITVISQDFANRLGKTLKEFYALLKKPDEFKEQTQQTQRQDINLDVEHFAEITTKVLKRLGGAYAHLANEIDDAWNPKKIPKPPSVRGKTTVKKILFLVANTKNTSRQQFEEQVREIDNALQQAKHREQFELVSSWTVRPRDVQRAMLDENPQIVHFLGSAAGTQRRQLENESERKLVQLLEDGTVSEGLVFEDETGQSKPVSGEALATLFQLFADTIECVVFNVFYSEIQAKAISQYIPYVIGMKQAIRDKAAIEFAVAFYDALGAGYSFQFAFNLGCASIKMAGISEHLTPVLHREKFSLPPVIGDTTSKSNSLEDHYNSLIKAITRGRMVPFLGLDINLCDRPVQANGQLEPWKPDDPFPPSGKDLAAYLAKTFPPPAKKIIWPFPKQQTEIKPGELPGELINQVLHENATLVSPYSQDSLTVGGLNLPYLSQYAYLTRQSEFYTELQKLELGCQPNTLHKFFATLPAIMREKGYYPPYPLIVTTNYDCALEEAFKEADEPFDLVFYSNIIESGKLDRFIHQTPDDKFIEIEQPNTYNGFSFTQRPVILKLYGSADQIRQREGESVVITEEHFLEYLVTRKIANLLPVQLLKKLRAQKPNILFLGYPLGDWTQRILLHRIWPSLTFRKRYPWWAIQSNLDPLAQKFWHSYDVVLYDIPLRDYISELKQRVLDIPVKGDKGYE